ncbi:MAG TPA: hypothetical protein VGW40_07645 [Allosphingosinicella sp.]|nr:hypothetical protein [Allosphingosinicella sp.]
MANGATNSGGRAGSPWRVAGWSIAALLLLLPLVAMRFTAEVNWTVSDFLFAGLMIGIVGVTFELTVRVTASNAARAAIAVALAAAFLTIWANGAVGMIGDEDNPFNLLFFGVIALALAGAIVARFRPAGMALAMAAAAVAQVAIAAIGLSTDPRGGVLSAAFGGLWLLSAALFRKAAREQQPADAAS